MAVDVPTAERLARLFRFFAATQCAGRSLVYEALSEAVAADQGLLSLLCQAQEQQRRPSLLFAAVNLLLAADPQAELAAYYPVHGGHRPVDDRLVPAFSAFCQQHRDGLAALLRCRLTQTNEIRRCLALRLGLTCVSRRWPGPLALVEAGASAGLNLLFDRYRYHLGDQPPAPTAAGSPVVIASELRGGQPASPVLGPVPAITARLGVDLQPLDLTDPGARAWLEAFVWPEQVGDLVMLRAAIEMRQSGPAAPVVQGDATTDIARIISSMPGEEPVVVFTASLLSYLGSPGRAAFADQLDRVAAVRPVAWVFAEAPALAADAGVSLADPLAKVNTRYVVGASLRGVDRERQDQVVAVAEPYLRWVALSPALTAARGGHAQGTRWWPVTCHPPPSGCAAPPS